MITGNHMPAWDRTERTWFQSARKESSITTTAATPNRTDHLSFGTEVEFSNNFIFNTYDDKTFFINPTIAVKWNL